MLSHRCCASVSWYLYKCRRKEPDFVSILVFFTIIYFCADFIMANFSFLLTYKSFHYALAADRPNLWSTVEWTFWWNRETLCLRLVEFVTTMKMISHYFFEKLACVWHGDRGLKSKSKLLCLKIRNAT
jgi:hypothetical protein